MKVEKVKKRDRERTKGKILKAVGEVIEKYGTEKVGVNLIARTAGVNKVLIYRYFESIDGLMEQYVKSGEYATPTGDEFIDNLEFVEEGNRRKVLANIILTFLHDLRERKATRDLLRWEIGTGKSMLSDARNNVVTRILSKIGEIPNLEDTPALVSFLTGGIYYLTISADYRESVADLNLQTEDGWHRIENVIEKIIYSTGN